MWWALSRLPRIGAVSLARTGLTASGVLYQVPCCVYQARCLPSPRSFSTVQSSKLPKQVPPSVREVLFILGYKFQSLDKGEGSRDQIIGALSQLLTAVRQAPGLAADSLLDVICCDSRYQTFERCVLIPAIRTMDLKQTVDLLRCVSVDTRSNENMRSLATVTAERMAACLNSAPHACRMQDLGIDQTMDFAQIFGVLHYCGVSSDLVEPIVRAMAKKAVNWAKELHTHGASWVELNCLVGSVNSYTPCTEPLIPVCWQLFERVSSDQETAASRGILAVYGPQLALGLSQLMGSDAEIKRARSLDINSKLVPRIAEMTPLMPMTGIADLLLTLVNLSDVIGKPSSDGADQVHGALDQEGMIIEKPADDSLDRWHSLEYAAWDTIKQTIRGRLSEIVTIAEAQLVSHCLFYLDWMSDFDVEDIALLLTRALDRSGSTVPTPDPELAENIRSASSDLIVDLLARCSAPFAWNVLRTAMLSSHMPPEMTEQDRLWARSLELAAQDPQKAGKTTRNVKFDDVVRMLQKTGPLNDANLTAILFARC